MSERERDGAGSEGRVAIAADIGKTILVGVSYYNSAGQLTQQTQHVGEVIAVGEDRITIRWENGKETTLPPIVDDAAPGNYRLRSTGRTVENPDLLARWSINAPPDEQPEKR